MVEEFVAFHDVEGGIDKVEGCADKSESLEVVKHRQIMHMVL